MVKLVHHLMVNLSTSNLTSWCKISPEQGSHLPSNMANRRVPSITSHCGGSQGRVDGGRDGGVEKVPADVGPTQGFALVATHPLLTMVRNQLRFFVGNLKYDL